MGDSKFVQALAAQEKLNHAFALMRKRGLVARQRFKCCGSCAGYALAVEIGDKATKDARIKSKFKGCCFYSKQGGFVADGGRVSSCFLQFGPVETQEHGRIGLVTPEVGRIVCECLAEAGLAFVWDGKEDSCVEVKIEPPPPRTAFERVMSSTL